MPVTVWKTKRHLKSIQMERKNELRVTYENLVYSVHYHRRLVRIVKPSAFGTDHWYKVTNAYRDAVNVLEEFVNSHK